MSNSNAWYPSNKTELSELLDKYLKKKPNIKEKAKGKIHGLIVPHAGYQYSGEIAGKAFSLIKNKNLSKAVILSPSHYLPLREIATHNQPFWRTPLGETKVTKTKLNLTKLDISIEHAIDNQIPFIQKLGIKEILPILVGQISLETAGNIARKLSRLLDNKTLLILSTDLSHFLDYEEAVKRDKRTLELIKNTDTSNINQIDACGIFPILILMRLCKLKSWTPKLLEYKNSGDITGDKDSVVGYCSMIF